MKQVARAGIMAGSNLVSGRESGYGIAMSSLYVFECFDADGNLKWREECHNLVVDAGLNDLLDKYFKGSAYTAAFYVGLKGEGTIAAADTLASHAGWTEFTDYSGNRKALQLGSVSSKSVSNSANKASFSISNSGTVAGGFVATAESGTTGVLYGAADFGSARSVESGDTLNVTVTLTAADGSS